MPADVSCEKRLLKMNASCPPKENKPLNDGGGGFMNTEQSKERGNEIIGSAYFSIGRALFRMIRVSVVFSLCVMTGFITLSAGEPLLSVLMFVGCLLMFPGLLDLLLSDRIIFYGNRVTKIWHILRPRTIYFSRAKVGRDKSRDPLEWEIRETGPNGEYLFIQKLIFYNPRFFPSEASQEIQSLLTDLADDEIEGRRYSKKADLIAVIVTLTILLCVVLFLHFFHK